MSRRMKTNYMEELNWNFDVDINLSPSPRQNIHKTIYSNLQPLFIRAKTKWNEEALSLELISVFIYSYQLECQLPVFSIRIALACLMRIFSIQYSVCEHELGLETEYNIWVGSLLSWYFMLYEIYPFIQNKLIILELIKWIFFVRK